MLTPVAMTLLLGATVAMIAAAATAAETTQQASPIAIAIHGGAGTIERAAMTPEKEAAYRATLEEAVKAGHKILADGGTSMDAVTAAVRVMEDSPLFNAGKGAVYTADEKHELDAAVMDGKNRAAGAVAAVSRVRNPIDLARLVMEKSEHVLLVGEGAERFAVEQGVQLVDPSYFDTPERLEQLHKAQDRERAKREGRATTQPTEQEKHGTVGAVALDRYRNLAAATSTGGMTNKRFGRVGDTPLIGAGTYADNDTCAASGTGHGEFFMRLVLCHEIASQMRYSGKSVNEAANDVVVRQLKDLGGTGGVIAIDRRGNIAMPFNTSGMYRASIGVDGKIFIAIWP